MEFPTDRLTGEAGAALLDLVEQGTIRVLDLVVIHKDAAGKVQVMELTDPGGPAESFAFFAGARSGLLGDDDVAEAAAAMDPGRVAALLVYENTWAAPFATALRRAGAQLVANGRIPVNAIIAALDELEKAES
jgi:hypothetical protein